MSSVLFWLTIWLAVFFIMNIIVHIYCSIKYYEIGLNKGRVEGYTFAKNPDWKSVCDVPESLEYHIHQGDYRVWKEAKREGKFK